MIAYEVGRTSNPFGVEKRFYLLQKPWFDIEKIVIFGVNSPTMGPVTAIFSTDDNFIVNNHKELPGSLVGRIDFEAALEKLGYNRVEPIKCVIINKVNIQTSPSGEVYLH